MNVALIWIACLLGQIIHIAVQIDAIVRAKNNTAVSFHAVLKDRLIQIIARLFACTAFFGVAFGGGLSEVYRAFDAEPPHAAVMMTILLSGTGVVGVSISALIGLALDSLIGFVPFFKAYLPPPIGQEDAITEKSFAKGVDATKEAAKQAVEEVQVPKPDK